MNFFDIAILAVLAGFLLKGLLRGLLREVCSLLGLVTGSLLALRFHGPLAATMAATFHLPAAFCAAVTFALVFLAAVLVFWGIGYLLSRLVKLPLLGGMNRLAGGFFGLAESVLLSGSHPLRSRQRQPAGIDAARLQTLATGAPLPDPGRRGFPRRAQAARGLEMSGLSGPGRP